MGTSDDDFERTRARFQELLEQGAGEPAFQRLFASHPELLAGGLPIRVDVRCVHARGRPGRTEADFIFVRSSATSIEFGVIELKRPNQRIVKSPRKRVVTLTNAAVTAVAQAREYAAHVQQSLLQVRTLEQSVVRNPLMYVVMGMLDPRTQELLSGLDERQLRAVFPDDVRFVTYDQLLARSVERSQVRALAVAPPLPPVATSYVMLPTRRGEGWHRAPFALAAPDSLVEALRRIPVRGLSVYSQSLAGASAAECIGSRDDNREGGNVYLIFATECVFVLTTRGDRVMTVDRAEHRDERSALAAAGAGDKLLHQTLDPSAKPWLVRPPG